MVDSVHPAASEPTRRPLRERTNDTQGKDTELVRKVDEIRAELRELKDNQLSTFFDHLTQKDRALSSMAKEKTQLSERLAAMTERNAELERSVKGLKESQEKSSKDLLEAVSASAAAGSTVASLTSSIEELRRENQSLLEELFNSRGKTVCMETQLEGARADVLKLRAEKGALQEQLGEARGSYKCIETELQGARADLLGKGLSCRVKESEKGLSCPTNIKGFYAMASCVLAFIRLMQSKPNLPIPSGYYGLQWEHWKDSASALQSVNEKLCSIVESLRKQLNASRDDDEVPLNCTSKIDFDDVSTTTTYEDIPNGYRGFNWESFRVIHRSHHPGSGYERGTVSGDYVAYNWLGGPCSVSSATPFSVAGFQATAACRIGLDVLVEGFGFGGNLIGGKQITLGDPDDGPTFVDLRGGGFEGLYKVKFTASGGTVSGRGDHGAYLAIDDLLAGTISGQSVHGTYVAIDDLLVY